MDNKFSLNNLRLAAKGFVTLWVPIAVAIFPDLFPTTLGAVAVMAALTGSIDLLFRIWNIGDEQNVTVEAKTRTIRKAKD